MFTAGACFAIVAIAIYVGSVNNRDETAPEAMIRQARQDIRLVAYLLAGNLVMLGIIADRLH